MKTTYEWDIETVAMGDDGEIEIIDHDHRDRLHEFGMDRLISAIHQDPENQDGQFTRLVLVRDVGDELDGLKDRQWAYVEDGKLPDTFDGGANVPKRFIEEFNR